MTQESPSDRLRKERKRLWKTQALAAAACGVARETWNRYEAGTLSPTLETLELLARAGADLDYIASGIEPSEHVARDGEERTLLHYFRKASPEGRRAALGALLGASSSGPLAVFHGRVGTSTVGDVTNYYRSPSDKPDKSPR